MTIYTLSRIKQAMKSLVRDLLQLGSIVRRVRKKRGLSQSELGAKAGVRQTTISLMENGKVAKIETVLVVLAALDLELQIAPRSHARGENIEDLF